MSRQNVLEYLCKGSARNIPKHRSFSLSCFLSHRSTGYSEVIVVVGGCERVGGFNLPYTECYDPVTGEWKPLAKLPEFTKSEYAVCALRNDILVSGKTVFISDVHWSSFFSAINSSCRCSPEKNLRQEMQ